MTGIQRLANCQTLDDFEELGQRQPGEDAIADQIDCVFV